MILTRIFHTGDRSTRTATTTDYDPPSHPLSRGLGLRYAAPAQDGVPWGGRGQGNRLTMTGDESGLRVGSSLNRLPFSSPLSSTGFWVLSNQWQEAGGRSQGAGGRKMRSDNFVASFVASVVASVAVGCLRFAPEIWTRDQRSASSGVWLASSNRKERHTAS